MIRVAAVLAALAAAASAAAATGVRWSPLATGATEPNGSQLPEGYVAGTRAQERPWLARLQGDDRRALARVNLSTTDVIAVFLDGLPCASKVAVTGVTRSQRTLTVDVTYKRPPIGVATCVRTSTEYYLLAARRSSLGRPLPTRVDVVARARA